MDNYGCLHKIPRKNMEDLHISAEIYGNVRKFAYGIAQTFLLSVRGMHGNPDNRHIFRQRQLIFVSKLCWILTRRVSHRREPDSNETLLPNNEISHP